MRCIVIGVGNSGIRFLRAVTCLESSRIEVVGIAEKNREKLQALAGCGVRLETDYKKLLKEVVCDLVVIATNDNLHFEILEFISSNAIKYIKIICEKPVVTLPEHCEFVSSNYSSRALAISFVERYSYAVRSLKEYIQREKRKVVRVFFDWSKNRIKDPRPTVGVVSEITHPIDLACYIGGISPVDKFEVKSCFFTESDFVRGGENRPDTIMMCVEFSNKMLLTGTSSYLRNERCRRMEFLLSGNDMTVSEIAVLRLDDPKWDNDHLKISRVTQCQDDLESVLEYATPLNPNVQRQSIEKICTFLDDVLTDIHGSSSGVLPGKDQALYIQRIVSSLEANKRNIKSQGYLFKEPEVFRDDRSIRDLRNIGKLLSGNSYVGGADDWCDRYQ